VKRVKRILSCSAIVGLPLLTPTIPAAATPTNVPLVWCSSLHASWANQISPATGEDPMPIVFTNIGRSTCSLKGYASVAMIDAKRAALPFHYGHRSLYFKTSRPTLIVLAPGGHAYEIIAKYRCDLGERVAVGSIRIVVPETHVKLAVYFGGEAHRAAYCKGGRGDPGNYIGVASITRRENSNLP
jgi:hypothetical protein